MKTQRKRRLKPEKLKFETNNQEHKNRALKSREEIISRVKELTEPLCEAEGFELVHVEHQWERGGSILRLYIDKPGGVTLDDCVYISRQVSDLLDVDLTESSLETNMSYRLEVSSPGPDRPLGKKLDFERFKGRAVKIKTTQPVEGRKTKLVKGVLLGISEGIVRLLVDDKTVAIPFQEIGRARLIDYNGENRCS